jgi:hypothetical protein
MVKAALANYGIEIGETIKTSRLFNTSEVEGACPPHYDPDGFLYEPDTGRS